MSDKTYTVELTFLEIIAIRAMIADGTTADDALAVSAKYGRELAERVAEVDAGYTAYAKLGDEIAEEEF